jgi:hypothetical protein
MGSNLKFLGFKFEIHRIPSKQGTAIRLSAALYFDAGRDPFLHRLDQVPIEADHPPSSRSDAAIAVQAAPNQEEASAICQSNATSSNITVIIFGLVCNLFQSVSRRRGDPLDCVSM